MIVILNKDVKGTGKAGDVVKVNDGFARNMLLPKGLATEATKGNVRHLEKQKEIAAEKKAAEKAAAVAQAEKIKELAVVIKTKAVDGGKIFGSITSKDIAEELKKQKGITLDKRWIETEAIKSLGEHTVGIWLHPQVSSSIKVIISEV